VCISVAYQIILTHVINAQVTWTTVRYMISEIQYGGRITDDWDRVQMNVFAEKFFKQEVCLRMHVLMWHGIESRGFWSRVCEVGMGEGFELFSNPFPPGAGARV
jgi:dynein heavy chain